MDMPFRSNMFYLKYFVRKSYVYIGLLIFTICVSYYSMSKIQIDIMQASGLNLINEMDNRLYIELDFPIEKDTSYVCLYENKNNKTYRLDIYSDEMGFFITDLESQLVEKIISDESSIKAELPVSKISLFNYIFIKGGKNG